MLGYTGLHSKSAKSWNLSYMLYIYVLGPAETLENQWIMKASKASLHKYKWIDDLPTVNHIFWQAPRIICMSFSSCHPCTKLGISESMNLSHPATRGFHFQLSKKKLTQNFWNSPKCAEWDMEYLPYIYHKRLNPMINLSGKNMAVRNSAQLGNNSLKLTASLPMKKGDPLNLSEIPIGNHHYFRCYVQRNPNYTPQN